MYKESAPDAPLFIFFLFEEKGLQKEFVFVFV